MFKDIWNQRVKQAEQSLISAKSQIRAIEKQIDALLMRIVDADSSTVIRAYEGKIAELEQNKLRLVDQISNFTKPSADLNKKLELALQFLASPWKLWENGEIALRRIVLKLAFKDPLQYHLNEGARTTNLSLPFKVLGGIHKGEVCYGAAEKTRTSTGVTPQRPQRCASTNSATAARLGGGRCLSRFNGGCEADSYPFALACHCLWVPRHAKR